MKKILNSLLIILIVFFAFIFIDNKVKASTPDAYMITCNPGEDSSIEMNIGWHTDLEYTNSCVIYTTKDDTDWSEQKTVPGTYVKEDCFNGISTNNASGTSFVQDDIFLDYNALLTDLEPDTEYMYKVGQNVYSEVQYFKTAGSTEFSFAWISDFHAYAPIPNRLKSAMNMIKTLDTYNKGFDFIFDTGDTMAWGGSYNHWQTLFAEEYHQNYMWAGVMGNHDYMDKTNSKNRNDFFRSVYSFPTNGYEGEEGVCYYFKYSNCLFITMNNETQTNATEVKKAQDWFEEVVQNNPAQYIIVSQHYQWFNGVTGGANNSTGYGRWKDLFDKYQVDLALSGNNHVYVRSHSLYQGKVSKDPNYGTTYIQAPSSDNERGQALGDWQYNKDLLAYRFSEGGKTIGGSIVNVTEEGIKVELLDRNGKVLDNVFIKARRDVFPMDKFEREAFENDINIVSKNNNTLLQFSNKGIGYVSNIEVKYNGNVITQTKLRKQIETLVTLNNLPKDTIVDLDINITYKDSSTKQFKIKANTKQIQGNITNYKVDIVNEGYKVSFDNTYQDLDKINVYLNNTLVKEEKGNVKEITIPSNTKSMFDKIKVELVKDNVVLTSRELNYYSSVDLNCDGVEDKNDCLYLQTQICNNLSNEDPQYSNLDINNDKVLDIMDATYLLMYLENKISSPMKKQFEVTFIDGNGRVFNKVLVDANTTPTINDPLYEGYTFIGWDKDFSNVTSDITVYALYAKN